MVDPTFSRVPEGDETTGNECVDLARAYGIALDPWQEDIVRGILRESGGTWSASVAGLVVGRQNGKGQVIAALELYGLCVLGENILHTAHAVKTSSDAFRRLWAVIQAHDDLSRLVERHSQMIGAEYIALSNGGRIAFTTRSASAGRGLSVDRLVVDEAEDLPAAEVGALAPTVFSRPHAQSLYFGTAPGPMHDAESFRTMRQSAHDGTNPRLAWWEWCAEWGSDVDDESLWRSVNPAVASGRVPLEAVRNDRSVLPVDQFKAERLSMWAPHQIADHAVFDHGVWADLEDRQSEPSDRIVVGLDAPPSRDTATVCLAAVREDGLQHVEWYTTEEGISWLPEWVAVRMVRGVRAVVIDERSPLAELDWKAAGVRVTLAGSREVSEGAGGFWDAVHDRKLRHRGQVELSRGVLDARTRPMRGGHAFAWDRKAPGSSALIAASLALWGVDADRVRKPMARKPGESGRRVVVL